MVYKCSVCGYIYDEEKEGKPFSELKECPVCKHPASVFVKVEEKLNKKEVKEENKKQDNVKSDSLEYESDYRRIDETCRYMTQIHEMAVSGKPIIEAMGTKMSMPGFDDILFLGAQLNPMPLDEHAFVRTTTVIGKNAKRPMILNNPVYISHMSFGALSKEIKVSLSKEMCIRDRSTITPPRLVPCPPINLVAEWTMMSAPYFIGLNK